MNELEKMLAGETGIEDIDDEPDTSGGAGDAKEKSFNADDVVKAIESMGNKIVDQDNLTKKELADAIRAMRESGEDEVDVNDMSPEERTNYTLKKVQEMLDAHTAKTDEVLKAKEQTSASMKELDTTFSKAMKDTVLKYVPEADKIADEINEVKRKNPNLAYYLGPWRIYSMLVGHKLLKKLQKTGENDKDADERSSEASVRGKDLNKIPLSRKDIAKNDSDIIGSAIESARKKHGLA